MKVYDSLLSPGRKRKRQANTSRVQPEIKNGPFDQIGFRKGLLPLRARQQTRYWKFEIMKRTVPSYEASVASNELRVTSYSR